LNKFDFYLKLNRLQNYKMKLLMKPLDDTVKELYHDSASDEANLEREERGDAGLDLYCPDDITIDPRDTKLIDLKIQCEALSDSDLNKHVSYYLRTRSSIYKTPLRLANNVGIIDAGYRGNIMAAVDNLSDEPFQVQRGQRLFQITGRYLEAIQLKLVESLSNTIRGGGGFGSTGN